MDMATVSCIHYDTPGHNPIPPDGTSYFVLGPLDVYQSGAITVTAHPRGSEGNPAIGMYMEVIQMATRKAVVGLGGFSYYLDIVVRNNTHLGTSEATTIKNYDVYVSVITP
jgi:hypothetical protein